MCASAYNLWGCVWGLCVRVRVAVGSAVKTVARALIRHRAPPAARRSPPTDKPRRPGPESPYDDGRPHGRANARVHAILQLSGENAKRALSNRTQKRDLVRSTLYVSSTGRTPFYGPAYTRTSSSILCGVFVLPNDFEKFFELADGISWRNNALFGRFRLARGRGRSEILRQLRMRIIYRYNCLIVSKISHRYF